MSKLNFLLRLSSENQYSTTFLCPVCLNKQFLRQFCENLQQDVLGRLKDSGVYLGLNEAGNWRGRLPVFDLEQGLQQNTKTLVDAMLKGAQNCLAMSVYILQKCENFPSPENWSTAPADELVFVVHAHCTVDSAHLKWQNKPQASSFKWAFLCQVWL